MNPSVDEVIERVKEEWRKFLTRKERRVIFGKLHQLRNGVSNIQELRERWRRINTQKAQNSILFERLKEPIDNSIRHHYGRLLVSSRS